MQMIDIPQILSEFFSPLGVWGLLICIFILFYIDAIIFPTLPELFTVLVFLTPTAIPIELFAVLILMTIAVAEVLGLTTLYLAIKRARIPKRIENGVIRYQRFLICPDERMILINRLAPTLPFLGAFVAICHWSYRKAIFYTLLGGIAKYGIILAASGAFIAYMERGMATAATLIMVVIVIALSFIASAIRRKRMGASDAHRPA